MQHHITGGWQVDHSLTRDSNSSSSAGEHPVTLWATHMTTLISTQLLPDTAPHR